jgi:3-methyladenine DNA glycosylase AlkD
MSQKSATEFIKKLKTFAKPENARQTEYYFKTDEGEYGEGDTFIGVRMGQVFALAKEFSDMQPKEIEKLLESPIHEARAGAVSIMDFEARKKKTLESRKKELFELYLKRHDRINNWDLVDRAAQYVIGSYLFDKNREILYKLVYSKNLWERRTAIVSTAFFIRNNDLVDTFKIAEILLSDKEDLIHKATGWMLRYAGDKNHSALTDFLDKHAKVMPRTMLRYALEHFEKDEREKYMKLKKLAS